eukprot:TRINITY_DN16882_c0_g1_i1.p1 TRINITY_DN16882_c0_g1~~TRINITY_DN16882_c0_g1_i1.p1  ORF type:complete len:463 (-),score=120.96 TRINITY_DN16882_c0_g1_i1:48-1436(-)
MDLQWFVDEKAALDHDLVCVICANVMVDPTMVTSCQHSYCKECLDEWLQQQTQCPGCRTGIKETIPDRRAKKQISTLQVRCKNAEYGCSATGELGTAPSTFWDKHEPLCTVKTCEFCSVKTNNLDAHLNICELAFVPCPFKKIGCDAKLKKDAIQKHVDGCMEWHYFVMIRAFAQRDAELTDLPVVAGDLQEWEHTCAGCAKNPIFGSAFKCMTCNPSGSHIVCLECKSMGKHAENHNLVKLLKNASFAAVQAPLERLVAELKVDAADEKLLHSGVTCDGCKVKSFNGTRHKCMICSNFDLCGSCATKKVKLHEVWHPMISLETNSPLIWYGVRSSDKDLQRLKTALLNLECYLPWRSVQASFTEKVREQWIAEVKDCSNAGQLIVKTDDLKKHMKADSWKSSVQSRVDTCFSQVVQREIVANPALAKILAFEWMVDWEKVDVEKKFTLEKQMDWRKAAISG